MSSGLIMGKCFKLTNQQKEELKQEFDESIGSGNIFSNFFDAKKSVKKNDKMGDDHDMVESL